jgi:hypothetical protein
VALIWARPVRACSASAAISLTWSTPNVPSYGLNFTDFGLAIIVSRLVHDSCRIYQDMLNTIDSDSESGSA